MTESNQPQI